MKEVETEFKEATIAIDFDGVIHQYSKGFQGLDNAYDPPMPGVRNALDQLKLSGYRLIIVSSRPVPVIKEWLEKNEMSFYFDDVSNTKHPAKYYIDDHAIRFDKTNPNAWLDTLNFIDKDTKKTSEKRAMFVGRWQPLHNGHKWLINQKLKEGVPVLICVRDIPPDEKNPFTTEQTIDMLETVYNNKDVVIMSIPDIESVNYGRGVGYGIAEHVPPQNIGFISATQIRNQIEDGDDSWKENVDAKIHLKVVRYLEK